MNIPRQSSPVIRNLSAVRVLSQTSGIEASRATRAERSACIDGCSSAPNRTAKQICESLCRTNL